jgi:heterodisulfide reductase subunit C
VEITELDPTFKFDVAHEPGGEQIMRCFACGTCTASCPVREIDEKFNPRRIIRMVLLGMRHEVLSSDFIWLCSTCYSCQERCPQDVKITELMSAICNLAVKSGYLPAGYKIQLDLIHRMGRLYEIDEFDNKKRAKAGLPELESTNEDVKKIYAMTGADRLLEGAGGGGE